MDISDASALADLQMHWDEAYEIGLDGDIWSAQFRGTTDQLRAHTSHELRELIRTDYTYRHHASRAQGAGGSVHVSADVSGSAASPPGPDSSEGDADSYGAHYDNGTRDDEDVPPAQPRASFADIRGERMST